MAEVTKVSGYQVFVSSHDRESYLAFMQMHIELVEQARKITDLLENTCKYACQFNTSEDKHKIIKRIKQMLECNTERVNFMLELFEPNED